MPAEAAAPSSLARAPVVMWYITQVWVDVVVTHPKGLGRVCPELMEEEKRKCKKQCPGGAPNPSVGVTAGGGEGDKADQEAVAVEDTTEIPEQYCLLEQEVWTECSSDCLQERYLDEACEKEAEVRLCR